MRVETTIHTIRHTQTAYNVDRRYAGTIDVPLSEAGIRDAREAASKLAGVTFDVVVTSTLKRTIDTAHLLVDGKVPVVHSKLCDERNFGVMEGLTWDEVQTLEPRVLFVEVGNDLHSVNPQGGEPFEEVWERAKRFRRVLFREHRGSSILVISHGVFLQMFHGVLRGLSCIESLAVYPSNLELATFRFSGNRLIEDRLVRLGSVEHVRW